MFLTIMAITVAALGEVKLNFPFYDFRIGLGALAFFMYLLLLSGRGIHPVVAGCVTGGYVLLFRVVLEANASLGDPIHALHKHAPALFFYLVYSLLFWLFGLNRLRNKPLCILLLGIVIELLANGTELAIRSATTDAIISADRIKVITMAAVIRSSIVVGFFNYLLWRNANRMGKSLQQENDKLLLFISGLYAEKVQLNHSLQHIEEITEQAFELHQELRQAQSAYESGNLVAQKAFGITGQIHEVKKNIQRVSAGLQHMISSVSLETMALRDVVRTAVQANEAYARLLKKPIEFKSFVELAEWRLDPFVLLSILNNLLTNAVEAVPAQAYIEIRIRKNGPWVELHVMDNGKGIDPDLRELIFVPGFTTKFIDGKASTGIGLSYIKEMVTEIGGTIDLLNPTASAAQGAHFIVRLPLKEGDYCLFQPIELVG